MLPLKPRSEVSPLSSTLDVEVAADDAPRTELLRRLSSVLGDALVAHHLKPGDDLWVRVRTADWKLACTLVRDELGMDAFTFVSAIDWMPSPFGKGEENPDDEPVERDLSIRQGYAGGETRFQLLGRFSSTRSHLGITLKADVPDGDLRIDSIATVYPGANWHEREIHEMFGITFNGHPNLKKLYLPGDFEGFPMRKDFPLLARIVKPWPGIVDVEPMPGSDDEEASE
jgi:NADH-quinone oxidoreductase subunit C